MKVLVPVTVEIPVGVLLYFAGLADKSHLPPKKAMSAVLTGFVEVQGEALLQKLKQPPFIDLDTTPLPHQNN